MKKPSVLPVVFAWSWAAILFLLAALMFVGIFTFPLGILFAVLGWRLAGKSYIKYWEALQEQENHREAAMELDGTIGVEEDDLPWLV